MDFDEFRPESYSLLGKTHIYDQTANQTLPKQSHPRLGETHKYGKHPQPSRNPVLPEFDCGSRKTHMHSKARRQGQLLSKHVFLETLLRLEQRAHCRQHAVNAQLLQGQPCTKDQPTTDDPSKIKAHGSSKGWPVTSRQASSITPCWLSLRVPLAASGSTFARQAHTPRCRFLSASTTQERQPSCTITPSSFRNNRIRVSSL